MSTLPITPHLPQIAEHLRNDKRLVLEAPPGAGKTTGVPLALLKAGLLDQGEVWILQPRRIAARMAARRVAQELGERVGERVGYSLRFEEVSGPQTQIRFVTEGILSRRLLSDPQLSGISGVLLDEFHERSLDADLALALLRRLQESTRPEIFFALMSATLDAKPAASWLSAPWLRSSGRAFDVAVEYLDHQDQRPLPVLVASALRKLLKEEVEGDVLIFLPGAAQIRRAMEACSDLASAHHLLLLPLHGELPSKAQDRVMERASQRKVIFSTNVAETSLTIDGVTAVIDSGLAHVAEHSPWTGLPRLKLAKISQASAIQRSGRAGRQAPGRCLRLYSRYDFETRPRESTPEIRRLDLAPLLLQLRASNIDPYQLAWFEEPEPRALTAASELLLRLGALECREEPAPSARAVLPDESVHSAQSGQSDHRERLEQSEHSAHLEQSDRSNHSDHSSHPDQSSQSERLAQAAHSAPPSPTQEAQSNSLEVSSDGHAMLRFPLHPRLARVLLEGSKRGFAKDAARLAALLGERDIRSRLESFGGDSAQRFATRSPSQRHGSHLRSTPSPSSGLAQGEGFGESDPLDLLDLYYAVENEDFSAGALRRWGLETGPVQTVRKVARQLENLARRTLKSSASIGPRGEEKRKEDSGRTPSALDNPTCSLDKSTHPLDESTQLAQNQALRQALLCGFPDRVAMRRKEAADKRGAAPEFLLSGGGSAALWEGSELQNAELLVALDVEERKGSRAGVLIRSASAVEADWLWDLPGDLLADKQLLRWNAEHSRVEASWQLRYGALVLEERLEERPSSSEVSALLFEQARAAGRAVFGDEEALQSFRARVAFVAEKFPESGVQTIDDRLEEEVLRGLCEGKHSFAELRKESLLDHLKAALGPELARLETLAPTQIQLAGGRRLKVNYEPGKDPWVASRMQDFFGSKTVPPLGGRVPLVLHLLAPNQRAVQVSQDLAGFWERHYPSIRRELMRRYPRHFWPEDPLTAAPPPPGGRRRAPR